MTDEVPLVGGRANLGSVVRIGDQVARPAHPQADFVDEFLGYLRGRGISFVPEPLGRDEQGRQRLAWIDGVAPTSPCPDWVWDEHLLADVARRQRELHAAADGFRPPADAVWAVSGGDYFPAGSSGELFCHNDLCMSNVIVDIHERSVAGFVDFDYVAPADRLFDIAVLARHWAPFGDLDGAGLEGLDPVARFRIVAEVHELGGHDRERVVDLAIAFLNLARVNVRALADAGNEGFRRMIVAGYEATNRLNVEWLDANRALLITV